VDALCELKTRKVLALAMATTEQIELDKNIKNIHILEKLEN
jgi:hypothetical protein